MTALPTHRQLYASEAQRVRQAPEWVQLEAEAWEPVDDLWVLPTVIGFAVLVLGIVFWAFGSWAGEPAPKSGAEHPLNTTSGIGM